MLTTTELIFTVALPPVLAAAVMLIACRRLLPIVGRRDADGAGDADGAAGAGDEPVGLWGPAAALGLTGLIAVIATTGAPTFSPVGTEDWRFWIVLGAALIALAAAIVRPPWWIGWPVRLAASLGMVWLVAKRKWHPDVEAWTRDEAMLWVGGLGLATFLFWTLLDIAARTKPRAAAAIALGALAGPGAIVLGELGALGSAAKLSGALAGAMAPIAIAALLSQRVSVARGGTAIIGLVLPALWLEAALWSNLPWWAARELGGAALLVFVMLAIPRDRGFGAKLGWRVRSIVGGGLVLLATASLAGWVVWNAMQQAEAAESWGGGGGDSAEGGAPPAW